MYTIKFGARSKVIKISPTISKIAKKKNLLYKSSVCWSSDLWIHLSDGEHTTNCCSLLHTWKLLTVKKSFLWLRWHQWCHPWIFLLLPELFFNSGSWLHIHKISYPPSLWWSFRSVKSRIISNGFSYHELKLPSSFNFSDGTVSRPFTIPEEESVFWPTNGESREALGLEVDQGENSWIFVYSNLQGTAQKGHFFIT